MPECVWKETALGMLPDTWDVACLDEAASKIQDGTHFSPKTTSGPKRYLTSKNVRFGFLDLTDSGWISEREHKEIYRRCDVKPGDVLLTKDGANTGNASLNNLTEEFSLLSSVAMIRCRQDRLHNGVLLHYLLSDVGQKRLKDMMSGNAITRLTLDKIKQFKVPVPESNEQSRIAEILDTLDAAIRETEAAVAKLRQVKAGLLHDLLTRGLDEHGHLRDPARHPEHFKDSPIGRIPKSWVASELDYFIESAEYGISDALVDAGSTPILRMNNLSDGEADLRDLKFTRVRVPGHLILKPGDVLFNRTNSMEHVGRTGIWRGQLTNASFASYLVRLNPHPKRMLPELLNLILNRPEIQLAMRRFATPAVHQVNINPTNLKRVVVAAPTSLDEHDAIADRIRLEDEFLGEEQRKLSKLHSLKRGLAHDLLTGRVRVKTS